MMQYAPWSFLLAKLMWKRGEAPVGQADVEEG
jgi:hypothetical protein